MRVLDAVRASTGSRRGYHARPSGPSVDTSDTEDCDVMYTYISGGTIRSYVPAGRQRGRREVARRTQPSWVASSTCAAQPGSTTSNTLPTPGVDRASMRPSKPATIRCATASPIPTPPGRPLT